MPEDIYVNIANVFKHFSLRTVGTSLIEVDKSGFWHPRSTPRISLKRSAKMFNKMGGKVIIEIGSGIQGKMSGNSVLVWANKTDAERIIAIDLDENHINDVKKATTIHANVEAIVADGIEFVAHFEDTIDLLYLDFWTPDPENALPGTGRAEAYLKAYHSARNKLNNHSMILIDDTDHIHPWKHSLIVPSARKDGFQVVWTGRQTLLLR